MQKKNKIIFFLTFYFFINSLFADENRIIVKVNNNVITSYELKNKILTTLILSNEEINQKNINITKPLVLKNLIDLRLKNNEIEKFKLEISEKELSDQLNTLANGNINEFKKNFEINNIDFEIYKNDLAIELNWRKLIFALFNEKVKIDESEIDLEIDKIIKEGKKGSSDYELSEVLVNFESQQEKEEKIKKIYNQIQKLGFENTISKFSESLSKNNNGDLGWVNSKSLSKEILNKIKNLNVGDVSEPIISGNTILFLKLKNKKNFELNNQNLEELRERVLLAKKNKIFNLYSNSHLSKLRNISIIEYK